MSFINLRRAAFTGFFVALLAIVGFFGLRGNKSDVSVAAQENRAADKDTRLKVENPDAFRASAISQTLSGLFAEKETNFDEPRLLPNRVEASKTLRVIFSATEENLSGEEFTSQNPDANLLKRGAMRASNQPLARQRAFELSTVQILIVSTDAEKRILWWDLQPDPRVFHAETADDKGVLSGATVYRRNAEMLINFPAAPEIEKLYFYSPKWNGEKYDLELIGNLDLSDRGQIE